MPSGMSHQGSIGTLIVLQAHTELVAKERGLRLMDFSFDDDILECVSLVHESGGLFQDQDCFGGVYEVHIQEN